jgi:SAM-dependent methyltransferase
MVAEGPVRDLVERAARRALQGSLPSDLVDQLIDNRLTQEPRLRPLFEEMTDEEARLHFGPEEPLEARHLRSSVRYFHAWRLQVLRERLGARLADARILDVGDTDGLLLKHLGKPELGFNLAPAAVDHIRSNGVEAVLGDGQRLPFDDGSFDCVFCFETLEHVESPAQLLEELARVCTPGGRVFVSIPWVPRTFIHARNPRIQRGYAHVFEFARADFGALVSHTPLRIRWEAVCDLIGTPSRPAQRVFLLATRRSYLLAGMFRRFQFFELELEPTASPPEPAVS